MIAVPIYPGIFAVELFTDKQGEVFVNETAPRVHNSGHHTIEANYSSQFDMLWRVILNYPLGNTAHILPAAIVNLLGTDGFSGEADYKGLNEILKMDNAFVHIYELHLEVVFRIHVARHLPAELFEDRQTLGVDLVLAHATDEARPRVASTVTQRRPPRPVALRAVRAGNERGRAVMRPPRGRGC